MATLARLIDGLRAAGYRLVTITELLTGAGRDHGVRCAGSNPE